MNSALFSTHNIPQNPLSLPRKPAALFYDWDNTLVDSWQVIQAAMNQVMAAYDLPPWTLEAIKEKSRESSRETFPRLFKDQWQQALDLYVKSFESIHMDMLTPLAQAESLLQQAHKAGLCQGVISNKTSHILAREVQALSWQGYFNMVTGAGEASHDKPHHAIGEAALAKLPALRQTPRDQIYYIGDTGLDMVFAKKMGFCAVLIGTPHEILGEERLPHLHFDDLNGFTAALLKTS